MDEYNADWHYSAQIHSTENETRVYTGVVSWWSLDAWCLSDLIDSGDDVLWNSYAYENRDDPNFESVSDSYDADSTLVYFGFTYDADTDQYDIDLNAEFSAIVSNQNGCPTIQIVASKHYKRVRAMCSPCYPGQCDIDSGDGWLLCYSLPPDMFVSDNADNDNM